MVILTPEPIVVVDERSKSLMFALLSKPNGAFEFAELLRLWFGCDPNRLARFVAWLDDHGLEIRKKQ